MTDDEIAALKVLAEAASAPLMPLSQSTLGCQWLESPAVVVRLLARLEQAESERDEWRTLVKRQDKTVESLTTLAERGGFEVLAREAIKQRDAARAECDRLTEAKQYGEKVIAKLVEERDAALGAPNGCHRGGLLIEHIERETAERIAQWLQSLVDANPDDWSVTPADIRAGAWRTTERMEP